MCLIVGIDGGGTKTRCAVSDGGTILGRGVSDGCNIVRLGEAAARFSIESAIRDALRDAQVEPASVEAACIGVAGSAVSAVCEAISGIVRDVLKCPIAVVGDQEIAFEAAFGDTPGILVIAGTGSIAFGRSADGRSARAGGHGFIVSDEGSGQWIGRTAVSCCLRALDTGKESSLMPDLLKAFSVSNVGQLIQAVNAVPLPNFSKLCPIVLKASDAGDAVAIEVLKKAGQELAALAKLVAGKLGMDHDSLRVATAGGIFEHCPSVRREFQDSLKSYHPHAIVIEGVVEPVLGALALARKEAALGLQPQFR